MINRSYVCCICQCNYDTSCYVGDKDKRYCSRKCRNKARCQRIAKPEKKTEKYEQHAKDFITLGGFHPDTEFTLLGSGIIKGKVAWSYTCGECGQQAIGATSQLKLGKKSCGCSLHSHKQGYINIISCDGLVVGVKFGICRDIKSRLKSLSRTTSCDIELYKAYKFKTVVDCKAAERECKSTLVCGVIDRELMKDGWTETTYTYNIEKIMEIYEKYGGVENEVSSLVGV